MDAITIRLATEADLPAIRAIYNYYVLNSTCTYQLEPETEADRLRWFQSRTPAHPVTVAEAEGVVVGWAALSVYNARAGYARTVESSVYLHHACHRKGIGRALMLDVIARARELGHHCVLAGVSADQTPSIRLHETLGFTKVAHYRELGFKFGKWLDVVYLQLML